VSCDLHVDQECGKRACRKAATDLPSHIQVTVLWTRVMQMSARWVCDFCGYEGGNVDDVPVDQIQCPMCGEPVTPLPSPTSPDDRYDDEWN
jgi:hypothetical protein